MRVRHRVVLCSLAFLLISTCAFASLKDIRTDKLPSNESVRKAYATAASVEEFSDAWSAEWHYSTPKEVVSARLKESLDSLQKAAASAPGNAELFLLTGVVAHYAYNVDVKDAYDLAVRSFQKAHQLAPDDYRPEWFLGDHECEAGRTKEGMEALLAVEAESAWDHLPPAFWDDYLYCATLANLPAHALRAGDYLSKLHAPPSETRTSLLEIARKRFLAPDPNANYSAKEAWDTSKEGSRLVFKSSICGFSFSPLDGWKLRELEVQKGSCKVWIETGPYHSKVGDIAPILLIIVRPAKPGETLADFMKTFLKFPSPRAVAAPVCPAEQCVAYDAAVDGHYAIPGNDRYILTGFMREAPEFPGLLFEEPTGPPAAKNAGASIFRPQKRLHRLDGTLYYMVMLDTADFVLDDSRRDYNRLMKYLHAE